MALITNLNINKNEMEFDLNNLTDIKISMANAIRRTAISDIETYNIDDHSIIFHENKSIFDDQFLIHRMKLIPIVSSLELNYDDIKISCHKENEDEGTIGVYVRDFEFKKSDGDLVDVNTICKHQNILFSKLKHGDKISFEGKLTKNNSGRGGASFCPVSKCIYTFKIDEEQAKEASKDMSEAEKKSFYTQDVQRVYAMNDDGNPSVYQFCINSISFFEPSEIMQQTLDILIDKMNTLKTEFRNENSDKIKLSFDNDQPDITVFMIHRENETMGNLLSSYLNTTENVGYCGYVIEHPSHKYFILKIKLNENNDMSHILDVIEGTIEKIRDILSNILTDFNKSLQ